MIAGPSQSEVGVPVAAVGGGGVRVTWAVLVGTVLLGIVLVGTGIGGLGVAVKPVASGEGIGVDSGGGGGVAERWAPSGESIAVERGGGVGVAGPLGAVHEINTLANRVMTPRFTGRFIVILLPRGSGIRQSAKI
jgi:hypothetical protein